MSSRRTSLYAWALRLLVFMAIVASAPRARAANTNHMAISGGWSLDPTCFDVPSDFGTRTVTSGTTVYLCIQLQNISNVSISNAKAFADGVQVGTAQNLPIGGKATYVRAAQIATVNQTVHTSGTGVGSDGTQMVAGVGGDTTTLIVLSPSLSIATTVSTDGQCPGSEIVNVLTATPIAWCYTVTNNGNTPVGNIEVSDDTFGPLGNTPFSLNPGQTVTLSRGDVSSFDETLTAHADGTTTATGTPVTSNLDPAAVNVVGPQIDIDVTVSTDGNCPGADTVTVLSGTSVVYCYLVSNIGDDELYNVDVIDGSNNPIGDIPVLSPGQSQMIVGSATPITVDTTETAEATGTDPYGFGVTATDLAKVHVVTPGIIIQKTASLDGTCPGQEEVDVLAGTPVTYCYAVTDIGDTTIDGVSVTDNGATIPVGTLVPGQTVTVTAPYVSTSTDADTLAVASGIDDVTSTPVASQPDGALVHVVAPALSIAVTASTTGSCPGQEVVNVLSGATVTWCYEVTNTGNVGVSDITVTDDVFGLVPGAAFTLAPGESATLSRDDAVTDDTTVTGVASGVDTVVHSNVVSNLDPAVANVVSPAIDIDVTVSTSGTCPGADSVTVVAGTSVVYCYTVTNQGDDPLSQIQVYDQLDNPIGSIAGLSPGQSATLVGAPVTVTGDINVFGGTTGTDSYGFSVSDSDTALVHAIYANLAVQKTAPASLPTGACSSLPYTITVTSNGAATAKGSVLTDTLPAGVSFVSVSTTAGACSFAGGTVTCALGDLPPGTTATITLTTTATIPSGSITNTASASCQTPETTLADNSASATTQLTAPALSAWESIASNFNGTAIPAGRTLWFSAVMKVTGLPASSKASVFTSSGHVAFSAGGTSYNLAVPASKVTFDPAATVASTTFDAANNEWVTVAPPSFAGNVFVAAVEMPVTTALPGGINPVTWSAHFASNTPGVSVSWQWAASVYTSFSADYGLLGVQPIDDNHVSPYHNSDHAGTPESFKLFVTGGARGGGGSNYTGSMSSTKGGSPAVEACQ